MVGFRCAVVLGHVTGTARRWGSCITVRMTFNAGRCSVRSVQREVRNVVIEGGGPPWACGVAHGAIRREPSCGMIRVGSAIVFRHVAAGTLRRCIREIAGGMATCAILDIMPARKRKEVVVGELRAPARAHRIVALDAIRGET